MHLVSDGKRTGNVLNYRDGLVNREAPSPRQLVLYRSARHVVHDQVAEARLGILSHVVDRDQVRMLDRHGEGSLAREALPVVGIALSRLGEHHLARILVARLGVPDAVHRAHGTPPHEREHVVVAELPAYCQHVQGESPPSAVSC